MVAVIGARSSAGALLALTLAGIACGHREPQRNPPAGPFPSAAVAVSTAAPATAPRPFIDLIAAIPRCDVDHRGLLFDAGTEAMTGRFGWTGTSPSGMTTPEHDGATWARMIDRKFSLTFLLTERTPIFVAARTVGYGARAMTVTVDEQPLGTLTFAHQQIRLPTTGTTSLPVDAGLHTLGFHFVGRVRDGDAFADIDWIRVGVPDENPATYGPPTLRDLVAPTAALGGVPHRSLALRAPGTIRCTMRLPRAAHLRAALGLQGAGEGEAEVRLLRDGKKPELLRTVRLEGSDHAAWIDIDVPLDPFALQIAALELVATQAPRGGRVLFGDPVIIVAAPPLPAPPARAVVLVVLDGVMRNELPPWSGAPAPNLPALTDLAATSTVFDRHRAPTTVVSAAMASILTGLPPAVHGLTDASARLPDSEVTIASVARNASVRAAMFTGVPLSFRAFGFAGAWERFVEHRPNGGDPATAPIDSAAAWIGEIAKAPGDPRMLAVVHARGAHPPWDVTLKELSAAAPSDYSGLVEPRRSAQTLAKMRKSKHAGIVTEADRQRIRALSQVGLAGQDRAIGELIAALKAANLWDATLLIVTGDVASGAADLFADGLDLKERSLELPLYVHFPGGGFGSKRVTEPTEVADIARSALTALGLSFSHRSTGRDLFSIAGERDEAPSEPLLATLETRYSARWGDLVAFGKLPGAPQLCDLAVDATCAFNRKETAPLALGAIFRSLGAHDLPARLAANRREPATIDAETSAALSVWGASD